MFVLSNGPIEPLILATPCIDFKFKEFIIRVTSGSLSGSPGLNQWVSGSSGSILVTRLQRCSIRVWYVPYACGHTVRVWYTKLYHTRVWYAQNVLLIITPLKKQKNHTRMVQSIARAFEPRFEH